MRLLVGLGLLILLFAALARIVPGELALPLYLFFVIVTIAFTGWERRRIVARRRRLEGELRQQRNKAKVIEEETQDGVKDNRGLDSP